MLAVGERTTVLAVLVCANVMGCSDDETPAPDCHSDPLVGVWSLGRENQFLGVTIEPFTMSFDADCTYTLSSDRHTFPGFPSIAADGTWERVDDSTIQIDGANVHALLAANANGEPLLELGSPESFVGPVGRLDTVPAQVVVWQREVKDSNTGQCRRYEVQLDPSGSAAYRELRLAVGSDGRCNVSLSADGVTGVWSVTADGFDIDARGGGRYYRFAWLADPSGSRIEELFFARAN